MSESSNQNKRRTWKVLSIACMQQTPLCKQPAFKLWVAARAFVLRHVEIMFCDSRPIKLNAPRLPFLVFQRGQESLPQSSSFTRGKGIHAHKHRDGENTEPDVRSVWGIDRWNQRVRADKRRAEIYLFVYMCVFTIRAHLARLSTQSQKSTATLFTQRRVQSEFITVIKFAIFVLLLETSTMHTVQHVRQCYYLKSCNVMKNYRMYRQHIHFSSDFE